HQNFAFDYQRRHGDRFTEVDIAKLGLPQFLTCSGVESNRVVVKRIEEDFSVRIYRPAVYYITAGNALRRQVRLGLVGLLEGTTRFREVERIKQVGERGDEIHRVLYDDRRRLVSVKHTGREGPCQFQISHVAGLDLIKT